MILQAPDSPQSTTVAPPATVRPLFRRQAIEHLSTRQYGTVLLTTAASQRWLTALFVGLVAAIVAFFFLFSTTRKAQCQGVLLPTSGVIRVLPMQAGVIAEKRVREGAAVKAGQVLFVLASERNSGGGEANRTISDLVQSRRDSYRGELQQSSAQARLRLSALQQKAGEMEGGLHKLDDQISLQQQRVSIAEQAYKRYSDLQATNYLSAAQLQDKQAELLDQRGRLADLQRLQSSNRRELAATQADVRELALQAQRDTAALQRNVAALEQDLTESEARREIVVRAPQAGVVTALTAEVGQSVAANQALAAILPAGAELAAEIYAPSRSAGFVQPGMTVWLRYQAYPYQKFGQYSATVTEVAHTSLRPEELALPGAALPAGAGSEPLYRIRLKLGQQTVLAYGQALPLKSGMLVDASIVLEQRKLIEWVLEPLYSIAGRG
ncbi:MAG: HlyD family efflux transporter periplasmic adaptor subunit [Burkholderiales bacterium]|nr:HlyD family efflux transporter periplasmic adaptor subunit [Burkholderiales bacterium]